MAIQVRTTALADVRLLVPDVFQDERGFFKELYSSAKYRALGFPDEWVQDSVSLSGTNVIRGLHGDPEMSKLVTVLRGRVWDVVVDLRAQSPTYLRWEGRYLSEHTHEQLYIPKGCAHGFLALNDDVLFCYRQSAPYDPQREFAYRWNDPAFGIEWPLVGQPQLSERDRTAPFYERTM